jgi:hypothetical protein
MFQFPGFASILADDDVSSTHRVAPFGHLRINSYLRFPVAFRSLSRPSSPLRAKAFPIRPSLLLLTNSFIHHHTPFCVACVTYWDFSYVLAFIVRVSIESIAL